MQLHSRNRRALGRIGGLLGCLCLVASAALALRQEKEERPAPRPCEASPKYRELDFWVGEWDVFAGDQKAGTNRIEEHLNGCLLLENWTSARGGYTGKSLNYYDANRDRWHQVWVDSAGTHITYEGQFEDGAMRFSGSHLYPDGTVELSRMTFTPLPSGEVRQLIEQSKDEGKTWYVWFDGIYKRKKEKK